jgi:hypothetical protein
VNTIAEPAPTAARQLALACLAIAAGGLLLAAQVDGNGDLVGTGFATLSIGAVVALIVTLITAARSGGLPRDAVTATSAVCGFCGLAFAVAGVLAPGGGWMFFEVLLLLAVLARGPSLAQGPSLGRGTIALLAAMLVFRLWIAYQCSQQRWQLMTIDVPILSSIPLAFLDPIKQIALGEFTPHELGLPPSGLDFAPTLALWSGGFVLVVIGMVWRSRAGVENENDRVHATIGELPTNLRALVEKLLPEEQWQALGLHSLSDRRLRKKIEQLVVERLAERREIENAMNRAHLLASANPGGFAGEIYTALARENPQS